MKKNIVSILTMAFALFFFQGCQYKYPMVPPPTPSHGEDDPLDPEEPTKGEVYFVSVFGDGDMDGSSWENAYDLEGLRVLLTDNTNLSNVTICLSEGEYVIGRDAGAGLNLTKDIKAIMGGYASSSAGEDLSQRDPIAHETIFSGDVNQNGVADDGDCFMFSVTNGKSHFDGITFAKGYIDNHYSSLNNQAAGPVFGIKGEPSITSVEVTSCIFRDNNSMADNNVSMNGHTTIAGGSCVLVSKGVFKARDCKFVNNIVTSRGGVVRGLNDSAIMFFDRCVLSNNKLAADGKGAWGSAVQLSNGCLLMNNCTLTGNHGIGADLNGAGAFLVVNTTIVNWETDYYAGIRCESKAGSNSLFMNNALFSEKEQVEQTVGGFRYEGTNKDITSGGYNLMAGYYGTDIKKPTDVVYGALVNGSISAEGCYIWNQADVATANTYAKVAGVIELVHSFKPSYNSDVTNLGDTFAEWVGTEGFAVDGRRNLRNPEKIQRGSYDAGL